MRRIPAFDMKICGVGRSSDLQSGTRHKLFCVVSISGVGRVLG